MGLLENFLSGAIGYGISEASKSHPLRDAIDERLNRSKQKVSLEDLIDEYARRFRLHQIAERYEEYDYEEVYGRR